MSAYEKDMRLAVEFVADRLYYVALSSTPPAHPSKHFFSIDAEMVYWNFYLDFGPLNLGHVYRFCVLLNNKLNDPKLKEKTIYFYSSTHGHKRANAAHLICSWALLFLNKSPEDAFKPFKGYPVPFPPWHDATPSVCIFQLTILDTLRGLYRAREYGFFDFSTFNVEEYEHFEQVENGDLNWVMNEKFIAFAGPHGEQHPGSPTVAAQGYRNLRPDDYVPYFKRRNVTLVVRLNKPYYDSKKFTAHGIDHKDMYFLDGSNPPDPLLINFISRAEETPGVVAVHCKAGLGRTGCCIGCYMMKHFRLTGEEIIGWLRIVRPGSIIGPQQQYMREMQSKMWREGDMLRSRIQQFLQQGGNPTNHPEFSPSVMRHYSVFMAAQARAAALAAASNATPSAVAGSASSNHSSRSAAAASITSPALSSKELSSKVAHMHISPTDTAGRLSTPTSATRVHSLTPSSSSAAKVAASISAVGGASSRPTTPSSLNGSARRPGSSGGPAFGLASSERAESESVTQGDMLQMRRHQQQQQAHGMATTPTSANRSQLGAAGASSFSSPPYATTPTITQMAGSNSFGRSPIASGSSGTATGTTPTSASRSKPGVGSYFSSWSGSK